MSKIRKTRQHRATFEAMIAWTERKIAHHQLRFRVSNKLIRETVVAALLSLPEVITTIRIGHIEVVAHPAYYGDIFCGYNICAADRLRQGCEIFNSVDELDIREMTFPIERK